MLLFSNCRFSFFVVHRKAVTILAHGFCWTPLPIQTAAQIAPPITSVPITSALVTLAIARRNAAIAMMSSNHSNHLPRYGFNNNYSVSLQFKQSAKFIQINGFAFSGMFS